MSRRIEIELTSARPDGTWTWRAAGAKEPRGVVEAAQLPVGASVGDVVRADADFGIDGITILSVLMPKGARKEPERLAVVGTGRDFEPVMTTLVPKGRGDRGPGRDGGERRPRRDEGERTGRGPGRPGAERTGAGPRRDNTRTDRAPRPDGARPDRGSRPDGGPRPDGDRPARAARPERPARPPLPSKPKPRRIRPGRVHVSAVIDELPVEHRPIAERLLLGGMQAVRQALEEQNATLSAEGKPTIKPGPLLDLAGDLQARLRTAEWRDRAEAALAGAEEIDLRDLRSVVAASSDAARDEETRGLADQLRAALTARQDREQAEWLAEIITELDEGRSVRALRLSSRPPKAGVPFPGDLAARLASAVSATLTAEAPGERWAAALDALAMSPVRTAVAPTSVPANPSDDLKAAVTRNAAALPAMAAVFGVEAKSAPRGPRGPRPTRTGTQGSGPPRIPAPPKIPAPPAPEIQAPALEVSESEVPITN